MVTSGQPRSAKYDPVQPKREPQGRAEGQRSARTRDRESTLRRRRWFTPGLGLGRQKLAKQVARNRRREC